MYSSATNGSVDESETSSMLLKCVRDGRVDVLRSLLSQLASESNYHDIVDAICCEQGTLLHVAVDLGSVDTVRTLLSSGVNPCVQNNDNRTAFQCASSIDIRSAFVQELLQAAAQSKLGRVCQMLSAGVAIDSIDSPKTGNTALHWAANFGSDDVVRTLCEGGANVKHTNVHGDTPLHDAVRRNNDVIVRRLLQYGADPNMKNDKGFDCFKLAADLGANGSAVLQSLSLNTVHRTMQRSASIESDLDRSSIISSDIFLVPDKTAHYALGKIEQWTDLLWPQPQYLHIDSTKRSFRFPLDRHLKIYFDGASEGEPRRLMQIVHIYAKLLADDMKIELEYRGHKINEHSPMDGRVTCGIFDHSEAKFSYTLAIEEAGVELFASDYAGIRYGFATFVQILHLVSKTDEKSVPALTIRDYPDVNIRAVFQDFSGCRILNTETLLQLATRLGYCKANYLFVNFEVRTTDRYQLPYTNRDLFHLSQVCDELFVRLVPSLDLNSSYIDPNAAHRFIDMFLDDFPLSKIAHFGANLASILINNRSMLDSIQKRVRTIYLSIDVDDRNAHLINALPPYVTLCVEGRYPMDYDTLLSPKINVVLKFSTSDVGYLCQAPESTVKKAILAARLGDKIPISGTMICELSTGCEIMPPSMSYVPEIAILGVSWNRSVDMKRFCFLLPRIAAEHILLDGNMTALFQQAGTLGRVEHELTRMSAGIKYEAFSPTQPFFENGNAVNSTSKKIPLSVFVEMILNPNNMALERLTPIIFKKARIELRRSLKVLDEARKLLPYNYELALVLAEIQLVTELMVLASRLGQSLCVHGANPAPLSPTSDSVSSPLGYNVINVGVANLPLTIRTDLANMLLEIRAKFQHTWMSRNIPSTLPNALKIFDNLFRALLPPSMQDYSKNLL